MRSAFVSPINCPSHAATIYVLYSRHHAQAQDTGHKNDDIARHPLPNPALSSIRHYTSDTPAPCCATSRLDQSLTVGLILRPFNRLLDLQPSADKDPPPLDHHNPLNLILAPRRSHTLLSTRPTLHHPFLRPLLHLLLSINHLAALLHCSLLGLAPHTTRHSHSRRPSIRHHARRPYTHHSESPPSTSSSINPHHRIRASGLQSVLAARREPPLPPPLSPTRVQSHPAPIRYHYTRPLLDPTPPPLLGHLLHTDSQY